MIYRCIRCGAIPATLPATRCAACRGLVDVTYDLSRVELVRSDDALVRYRGLLPCDATAFGAPIELRATPTLRARALGGAYGVENLFVKDETRLPTGSTKDRVASVALPAMAAHGVRRFVMTSTGNTSTAYARILPAVPGIEMVVFTPEEFLSRVGHVGGERMIHFALEGGTYADALEAVRRYEAEHRLPPEGGFFNPARREGLKLAFFEAVEQAETSFDWYVQAVSSAMGVWGVYKGAKELQALGVVDRLPRLLCVQQASCAPMVRAFEAGATDVFPPEALVERPSGIAAAILMGDPTDVYPYVAAIVRESGGTMIAVNEEEILAARDALSEHEGIAACASASAAVAGVLRGARAGLFGPNDRVLLNASGGEDRPSVDPRGSVRWLARRGTEWRA